MTCFSVLLSIAIGGGFPQNSIESKLKETKLNYKQIEGFYQLTFVNSEKKELRYIYIRSTPDSYLSLEKFEVMSIFLDQKEAPKTETLFALAKKRLSIGSLIYEKATPEKPYHRYRYSVNIDVNTSSEALSYILSMAYNTGISLEKEVKQLEGVSQ